MADVAQIEVMLRRAVVGTLATVVDGQPFQSTNLFGFDSARRAIYLHNARVGRTAPTLDEASRVCFSVFEMGRMLPADRALEFSVEYVGVVAVGTSVVVADADEQRCGLALIMEKYAPQYKPGADYAAPTDTICRERPCSAWISMNGPARRRRKRPTFRAPTRGLSSSDVYAASPYFSWCSVAAWLFQSSC